jgi:hypothetical protein
VDPRRSSGKTCYYAGECILARTILVCINYAIWSRQCPFLIFYVCDGYLYLAFHDNKKCFYIKIFRVFFFLFNVTAAWFRWLVWFQVQTPSGNSRNAKRKRRKFNGDATFWPSSAQIEAGMTPLCWWDFRFPNIQVHFSIETGVVPCTNFGRNKSQLS